MSESGASCPRTEQAEEHRLTEEHRLQAEEHRLTEEHRLQTQPQTRLGLPPQAEKHREKTSLAEP